MRNFIIVSMIAFGLIACENTTDTTTETEGKTTTTTFTGASDNTTTTTPPATDETTSTPSTTTEESGTSAPTETEGVEENNETNTVPTETEEETPQQGSNPSDPVEVDPTSDEVTLDDLTAEDLADIEILRDNIFSGLDVGKELYLSQVNLALEDIGFDPVYQSLDNNQELPEVSDCPYVEFYNNQVTVDGYECEYLVDKARSEAYSKLYGTLVANRENYDPDLSEQDFWFEQGAVSGLEEARVLFRVDLKAKQFCNQVPTPVKSSEEKGLIVGRQHFINSMNNWLTTNGYAADYPIMSDPIEVCQANESLLDPVYDDALNSISQAMQENPLCEDYIPMDGDDEIMFAQAQTDYSNALKVGIEDEFALAAVKIFKVVPCNVSDPLIVDVNKNGKFDVTTIENGVNFSFTGTRSQATAWLSGDGFLFHDRNSNGVVDNGTELFGTDRSFNGGFTHLAHFDSDKNGVIDHKDDVYKSLFVWVDTNMDGVSTKDEVTTLLKVGVMNIDVVAQSYNKSVNGNLIKKVSYGTFNNVTKQTLIGDVDLRTGVWNKQGTDLTPSTTEEERN
tara:strand:+ start:550 stop:2241 length:1692 start_codon:yes stop_codon:yes gene_type:complete